MQAIVDQYHPTEERQTATKVRFAAEPTMNNDDHLFNDADVSLWRCYSLLPLLLRLPSGWTFTVFISRLNLFYVSIRPLIIAVVQFYFPITKYKLPGRLGHGRTRVRKFVP